MVLELLIQMDLFITAVITSVSDSIEPKKQLIWKGSARGVVHTVESQSNYAVEKTLVSMFVSLMFIRTFFFWYSRHLNIVNIF